MLRLLTALSELILALLARFSREKTEKEKDAELSRAIDDAKQTGDTSKLESYVSSDK